MTAEAPAPVPELDFSLLSTGLGILSTSPAWPEVEAALVRLESGAAASDAERAADVALAQEYARKLQREADTIGRALVAGAAVGVLVEGERRTRIQRGLEVLSEGYRLKRLRSDAVSVALQTVMNHVHRVYAPPELSTLYSLERPDALTDWLQLVRKDVETVEVAAKERIYRNTLVPIAWHQWRDSLTLRISGVATSFGSGSAFPTLEQLVCAAAGIGPGAWLRIDPAAMTIWEWSRLLQGAMGVNLPSTDPPPPAWAGAAALWALGFPALDPTGFRGPTTKTRKAARPRAEESADDVAEFIRGLPPRTPEVAAAIVTADGRPQSAWLPRPPELAAVMIAPEELSALVSSARDFFPTLAVAAKTAYLVVELGADEAEPAELARALRGPLAKLPRVDLYPARPRSTPRRPFVVAPASPQELLDGLRTQARAQAQSAAQSQSPA